MGDMGDDFRLLKEIRLKEREAIEPTRFEYAVDTLMDAGHRVGRNPKDGKSFIVNETITIWPYTGWWSGKGVGSGRGVHNLVKALTATLTTPKNGDK